MSIISTIIRKLIEEASPKIIMAVIGGLVLVGGGTGVALSTSLRHARAPKITSTEAVVDEIKQIGQFRTSAYCDEIVIKGKLDSLPSVIARKAKGEKVKSGEIVLVQKAAVHAGVDFDKMEPEDLRLSGDTLFVALPAAEILLIDMDRTKQDVFLQKGKWDGDQVEELYGPAEKKLIQDALDSGVLTKAYANAKEYIEDFFRPFGYICVINQKQPQQ